MEQDKGVKLSKTILEMKFMKKTKEKVLKEQEDAEGQAMYSNEITEAMRRDGNIIFREASISLCKNLVEGRLSFGGMNPDVEKLMEKDYNKQIFESERKKEKDISDEQMAKDYSSVVDTIGNKFKGKRSKNKTFQKPAKDEPLV
ncbi:M-phase phosphoprotein 6 [Anthonomus grandis grandis]|uniref:M-phase phosphoprotein 6 n=1 Tax=Anthonomus grandis grandis TaxID=2921223 RepID=UPI0021651096|nr:M-phase phosphoprotein 6 [Anthonomus grandis grandis]